MFGHNDNNQKHDDPIGSSHDDIAASAAAIADDRDYAGHDNVSGGGTLGSFMPDPAAPAVAPQSPSAPALQTPQNGSDSAHASDFGDHAVTDPASPVSSGSPDTNQLLDIKNEALQALTPLVGQLEQTPEEQFRTTMMMIQASDNHSLINVAYEAAQKISNEKERAQALLDIVNEINYFTQQQTH